MQIIDDGQNLRNLRKLADRLVADECEADEIYECLESAYHLGKAEGRLEFCVENKYIGEPRYE